jgi:hypothetical protein
MTMNFPCRRQASTRLALLAALAALPQWACSEKEREPMKLSMPLSAVDAALKYKFRGMRGGELRVDSLFETDSVLIFDADTGHLFNIGMGIFSPTNTVISGYGGQVEGDRLVIPKHLRMKRYPQEAKLVSRDLPPFFEGEPIIDVTVPVAERIPEEALNDLRKNGGNLRLKLRIHPDTLLVGWDIARRPGYNPSKKDPSGHPIYVPQTYSWIGGDFREAIRSKSQGINQKGWYIDPKTQQRIETDF